MLNLIRLTFILLLFSAIYSSAFAAAKAKVPARVILDSTKVTVKKFNEGALNNFKHDKDFNYKGESQGEPSLWDRFWAWFWNMVSQWFEKIPYGASLLKYFLLGLSIGLIIYVILKAAGLDAVQLFRGESRKVNVPYSESLEDINAIDFDAEIENAVAQHNYRLAVRLLYLKCLKQLSDNNLIHWQIDKTNDVYIKELTNPEQKQAFGILTRQFEYIWYGNFSIDKDAFGNISTLFQNFKKHLA